MIAIVLGYCFGVFVLGSPRRFLGGGDIWLRTYIMNKPGKEELSRQKK
jgi:hypothetical protein